MYSENPYGKAQLEELQRLQLLAQTGVTSIGVFADMDSVVNVDPVVAHFMGILAEPGDIPLQSL